VNKHVGLLPAAREAGFAVLTNMPFEQARLFKVVEGQELPRFARDAGMISWADFILKWVVSNPDVTCVLPSTSDPRHAAENVEALRGPLPDPDMRQRMVSHMQTIPGFNEIGTMPWYPGKNYQGIIRRSQDSIRERI